MVLWFLSQASFKAKILDMYLTAQWWIQDLTDEEGGNLKKRRHPIIRLIFSKHSMKIKLGPEWGRESLRHPLSTFNSANAADETVNLTES